jgi:hypothetical protein
MANGGAVVAPAASGYSGCTVIQSCWRHTNPITNCASSFIIFLPVAMADSTNHPSQEKRSEADAVPTSRNAPTNGATEQGVEGSLKELTVEMQQMEESFQKLKAQQAHLANYFNRDELARLMHDE